jgi:hypothetical protein
MWGNYLNPRRLSRMKVKIGKSTLVLMRSQKVMFMNHRRYGGPRTSEKLTVALIDPMK